MKRLALTCGIALLAAIWLGPLLGAWRDSFAAGMVAHMGVVAVAAPLVAIGLQARLRALPSTPAALPVLASFIELIAVWGWHAPVMRAAAEASMAATVAEQATFLTVGVLLWSTSFAAPREPRQALAGAFALLLTSIHMTLLGALLALSPRSLYGEGEVTCFGIVLDAGQDQQLGGVIMLLVGALVYVAGGLWLVARLLEGPAPKILFRK
ncbi:MAG: cytochrome c oxidase assembly protein [Mesorhizobium sp.]|nr:cytochrome c oxidase assembly protein [Mesorhizobium sp.]MCO5161395.1 cytochrome c oxidase assembly protein [Mesorhizobium sp.]